MALAIWARTALFFSVFLSSSLLLTNLENEEPALLLLIFPLSFLASLPALVALFAGGILINRFFPGYGNRMQAFTLLVVLILVVYIGGLTVLNYADNQFREWTYWMGAVIFLLLSVGLGCYMARSSVCKLLSTDFFEASLPTKQSYQSIMEHPTTDPATYSPATNSPILMKGIITGVLILLMMIPTLFISSLVQERKNRQQEIVQEDSKRWAGAQKLSGLFLVLPYEQTYKDDKDKEAIVRKELIVLPEELKAVTEMEPVIRTRSIYDILLYRSNTRFNGYFSVKLPKDILPEQVLWKEAAVSMGLSDIKGIEEKVLVKLAGQEIELSPGLANSELVKTGLSAPVDLSTAGLTRLEFSSQLKLRGSEKLHFIPLAGNSSYAIRSAWPNPSFDGNSLPAEREVQDSGFHASWYFSKANLPFGTMLRKVDWNEEDFAFGVSMVQPADHYSKTERTVKYAILFIGLTFALFLVIELMQKKPVHPIQYVLIGIALSVFYTLLLSISEFLPFDTSYGIAAIATILLITLYAYAHFKSWKTASLFATVLSCLYLFAFVLVRLEDTALLVGSIGLFIILALVMYGTRKINWYPA